MKLVPIADNLHKKVDYFGKNNPRAIVNLAPQRMLPLMVDKAVVAMLKEDEAVLRQRLDPTPTINRLRMNFWAAIEKMQNRPRPRRLESTDVYSGVCSKEIWIANYTKDPGCVAWILTPPTNYISAMEEALEHGVSKIREILSYPLYNMSGAPDYRAADIVLKTVALLDQRVKGAVVQRVQMESKNLHVNLEKSLPDDIGELDKKLLELQGSVKQIDPEMDIESSQADLEEELHDVENLELDLEDVVQGKHAVSDTSEEEDIIDVIPEEVD